MIVNDSADEAVGTVQVVYLVEQARKPSKRRFILSQVKPTLARLLPITYRMSWLPA